MYPGLKNPTLQNHNPNIRVSKEKAFIRALVGTLKLMTTCPPSSLLDFIKKFKSKFKKVIGDKSKEKYLVRRRTTQNKMTLTN